MPVTPSCSLYCVNPFVLVWSTNEMWWPSCHLLFSLCSENYNMKCSVSIFKGDTVFFIPPMPEKSCSLKTAVTLVWKPPLFHRSVRGAILWSSEENNSKWFFSPAFVSLSRPQGWCLAAIPWTLTCFWIEARKSRIWAARHPDER